MELAQQRFITRSLDGAQTVTSEFKLDRQIIFLILLLLSDVMIFRWIAHWSYCVYRHWMIFFLLPTGLLMFAKSFSMGGKVMHRFSCLTESLGYASVILPLMSLGSIVIPLTPFSVIDPYLKAIDESLGFNVALIMTSLQQHIHWLYRSCGFLITASCIKLLLLWWFYHYLRVNTFPQLSVSTKSP